MSNQKESDAEIYISTDIEADGPLPGVNSMLSFASVAYDEHGTELSCFNANLQTLPEAKPDPRTTEWWEGQPEAWAACRKNPQDAKGAMQRYDLWLRRFAGRPVFVAYPLLFDMMFIRWYQLRFVGSSPFGHSGIDIKTFAYAALGARRFRDIGKRSMPRHWFGKARHTHVALDDAREQGELFFNIRRQLLLLTD